MTRTDTKTLQTIDLAMRAEERAREAARLLPDQWYQARNPRYEHLPMFIRYCPIGADTIKIWQPHGSNGDWRIYGGGTSVVRHHHALGSFDTSEEAMSVAEQMLSAGMKGVLLD
jgi:hypothetical protein